MESVHGTEDNRDGVVSSRKRTDRRPLSRLCRMRKPSASGIRRVYTEPGAGMRTAVCRSASEPAGQHLHASSRPGAVVTATAVPEMAVHDQHAAGATHGNVLIGMMGVRLRNGLGRWMRAQMRTRYDARGAIFRREIVEHP